MIGWVRQTEDRKAHVVTNTIPIMGASQDGTRAERERIGTKFLSACPWDISHFFDRDDYEWMPWGWVPTAEEACWICWRQIARLGGFEDPV